MVVFITAAIIAAALIISGIIMPAAAAPTRPTSWRSRLNGRSCTAAEPLSAAPTPSVLRDARSLATPSPWRHPRRRHHRPASPSPACRQPTSPSPPRSLPLPSQYEVGVPSARTCSKTYKGDRTGGLSQATTECYTDIADESAGVRAVTVTSRPVLDIDPTAVIAAPVNAAFDPAMRA